jgi:hypothetical protein
MFVRWNRIKLRKYDYGIKDYPVMLKAYVMASVRTEKGPRQKVVCYLGSDHDRGQHASPSLFWKYARINLSRSGLSEEDQARVIAEVARVIPEPASA